MSGWDRGWARRLLLAAGVIGAMTVTRGFAQSEREFLSYANPQPPYRSPEQANYNLKWGDLTGRFRMSVNMEYNDNINLAETGKIADFSIGPEFGLGFLYPISKQNVVQLDFSFGYRWYLNNPAVSTLSMSPHSYSHVDYYLMLDDWKFNLHDRFTVQTDPTTISQLSGAGGTTLSTFRRFINIAGIQAQWQRTRRFSMSAGYDHTLDISLTSGFKSFDRQDHAFSLGASWTATPYLTLGANASYTISDYFGSVQNDGTSFMVGPSVVLKLSEFVVLDGSVAFNTSRFDGTGTIGDTSQFSGYSFQIGAKHTINRQMSHDLRYGRSTSLGYGSNFSDSYHLQYGWRAKLTSATTLNITAAYETFQSSGIAGEKADRYLLTMGTAYRWSKNWSSGVAYTFSAKDSGLAGRDYQQNRITLDLTRQF